MNGDAGRQTRERLEHALLRLQCEPRSNDRRAQDRRKVLLPWNEFQERRMSVDRRQGDRRTPDRVSA